MARPTAPTSGTTPPLVRWWRQPDHYDWLSSYLHARQFTKPARILMTALAGSFAFMPVVMNFAPAGTYGAFAMTVGWLAGFAGLGFAVIWGTRWPTQRQSVTIALLGNGLLAASCLAQPRPLIGMAGCTALAVIAGYVALFHTAGYMVYNFALASSVGAVVATRLALSGEGVLAVGLYFVVIQLNVFVPFSIQAVVHALGIDLLQADRDPLTGLLNRRAFYKSVDALLSGRRSTDIHLMVSMVDLDQFKRLNDTRGHAAGDQALIAVAGVLYTAADGAIIGRAGGEEFLIAEALCAPDPIEIGQRLCAAIAALPHGVTASVGTAVADIDRMGRNDPNGLLRALVHGADVAMYQAKRSGGNQSRLYDGPVDLPEP